MSDNMIKLEKMMDEMDELIYLILSTEDIKSEPLEMRLWDLHDSIQNVINRL